MFHTPAHKNVSAPAGQTTLKDLVKQRLPPLTEFPVPAALAKEFSAAHNGSGINRIATWLMKANIDTETARKLIAAALEDALIATFVHVRQAAETKVTLPQDREGILVNAIMKRLPRIDSEHRSSIAGALLTELKRNLAPGRILLVDGGYVSCEAGDLRATIERKETPGRTGSPSKHDEMEQLAA